MCRIYLPLTLVKEKGMKGLAEQRQPPLSLSLSLSLCEAMKASSPPSASSPLSSSSTTDTRVHLTVTQLEQLSVEGKVAEIYRVLNGVAPRTQSLMLEMWRDKHVEYLTKGLGQLGPNFDVLDANRPWLCYWIVHSVALLGEMLEPELEDDIVDFFSRCQDKDGGYGGGPGQMPHLATTYAAVNALVTLGSDRALSSINRDYLYRFLLRMKDSSGAFRMHDGGEIDVCACYTAISVLEGGFKDKPGKHRDFYHVLLSQWSLCEPI